MNTEGRLSYKQLFGCGQRRVKTYTLLAVEGVDVQAGLVPSERTRKGTNPDLASP